MSSNKDNFEASVMTRNDDNIQVYRLKEQGSELKNKDVINLWQTNDGFVEFYIEIFKKCGFNSYIWEASPVSTKTINQTFEFVLIKTPISSTPPDLKTFQSYYNSEGPDNGIVVFPNLGKDATLVVPSPLRENANYCDLPNFFSEAPIAQQKSLWKVTGHELHRIISDKPTWISVAGGGVAWLHIRLDSQPKYYRYIDYTRI